MTSVTMGKGWKFSSSHRDRLLGAYGYGQDHANGSDLSDLVEEEVWSMMDNNVEHEETIKMPRRSPEQSESGGDLTIRNGRWVSKGGLSLAFEDTSKTSARIIYQFRSQENTTSRSRHVASSAPVNVPNWPNILRVDSTESIPDGYVDDNKLDWVPPHEYLAREYAHSRKTAATSVFEGVGRTLKGRDMSRVRDAVWGQTGFFG
ncbi:protein S40-6-like [Tasmannia lanceolata]|uniref:protein S40-6-like n=1 Tax=Tasmannia lanceolata TaxID=3420 RepID=UPI0040627DCF